MVAYFVILKTIAHKTFHQSTTRFQAMCLEVVEVAPSSIMEYRPHSGPEQYKYFCLYKFSFIGLKFMASLDFQCVLQL